jgi:hypothetical protein
MPTPPTALLTSTLSGIMTTIVASFPKGAA